MKTKTGHPNGEEANDILEDAIQCLELYAYDDAHRYQESYSKAVDGQLARCDTCILGYYKARYKFNERLKHEYGEEPVLLLEKRFDERDLDRITHALDRVERRLQNVEPSRRKKSALDKSEKMGLFEALCNQALLTDDFLLSKHFQGPFNLVQTNKPLSVPYHVPAAAIFLFDKHYDRRKWAISAWSTSQEPLTREDFDFAIRDALLRNARSIVQYDQIPPEPSDLARVWNGIGIIVGRLDNDLVTHSLRALDVDVFLMALEHLRYDVPGFVQLIQTIQRLLEIAPSDFWNAMGTVSPTTYIEQIFNNGRFIKIVEQAGDGEADEMPPMQDLLSWIKPFMSSLETAHQAQACHSICLQLLDRLQADRFPRSSRVQCYCLGLATLGWTLRNCYDVGPTLTPTGRIVATETLEVVSSYIKDILKVTSRFASDPFRESCEEFCLKIVKISLALECKFLRTDQEALNQGKELPEGSHSYAPAVWDAVVLHMDRGNVSVAKAALVAINDLTGLEKFKINADESYSKEKSGFNVRLGRLTHLVCQILERINDFDPGDLDELFRYPESATALVSSLFSPDANLYDAAMNLIKSISAEFARREAIGHLLKTFFETTLNAFSWSIKRIAHNRTYASCPRMLKTSTDVLDILCNSQDGLLRTRGLSGASENDALEDFWQHQWQGLWVIYDMTESWSKAKVADTESLREFCRDTMQFSDRLFDQYSIFANAIDSAVAIESESGTFPQSNEVTAKELLERPTSILQNTIKWLRLKDLFLVEIAVNLTKKMLGRLTEVKVVVAEGPADMLQRMVDHSTDGRITTNLTPQQKAELARALEENLGRPISSVPVVDLDSPPTSDRSGEPSFTSTKKKRATTIDLEAWRIKSRLPGRTTESSADDFGDSDIPDSDRVPVSRSIGMMDRMKMEQKSVLSKTISKSQDSKGVRPNLLPKAGQKQALKDSKDRAAEMVSFREKREKEQQAKKKRDAETLALLKRKAAGVGENAGVRGLGMKGKDYAPQGPSMMVSSGSESESEDEIDQELFGGVSKIKSSAGSKYFDAGKPMPVRVGPVKKIRQVRSAKDMRARLAPDLTQLHRTILGWDFFHDGDFPPGSERENFSFVTKTFKTPVEYQSVFEPLLILEAWQGILKSRDEGTFKTFEIKVASRMNVDAFLELSTTMPMAEGKELGLSEADIVLISKGSSPTKDAQQPHCFARVYKINRKKGVMEVTYRSNVGNALVASLVPKSVLYGAKVESITPLEREYGALLGLKYFDLCDEITRAKPSPLLTYTDSQLNPLVKVYDVNQAQAKAVRSAIDNDAFTLIQGPPGSGKTKTIVAIVGALLTGTVAKKNRGASIACPTNETYHRPVDAAVAVKKLLVCAPSNAAVDELVMRLKQGVKTTSGCHEKLNVVRLGRSDAVNTNVLDVTLEELVSAKLNLTSGKKTGSGDEIQKIMMAHKATCEEYNRGRDEVDALKADGKSVTHEQDRELEVLRRRKTQLSSQIDQVRDSGDTAARDAEISRRRAQQEILDNSHVICATLSGSGHEMFQSLNIEFETVIIDEAAQSIELSALIPLKYGCSKCILVGDPKQLPPTVLSREAARFQYEQSLFVRMQANHPEDVHLLNTQYRMHPEISLFPSSTFYDGRLIDGPGMASLRRRPWHQSQLLGPYRFFDVLGVHQSGLRGHSLINLAEVEVALKLYNRLVTDCEGYDFRGKVGIITPYKSQLRELRSHFASRYGDDIFATVEFNTTDAFQGRESEVIIFSCVRASSSRGIGFLSDIRRMNVGITRAKSSLWVLGNSQSLMNGEFWGRLIQDAKNRNRFTCGDLVATLSTSLLHRQKLAAPMAASEDDIEMIDADAHIVASPTTPSRRVSESATLDDDLPAGPNRTAYQPSGGVTGLNQKSNCARCGNFAHVTSECDNWEALGLGGHLCYRCGKPGCHVKFCKEMKCTSCGQVGHTQHVCTSDTLLPRKEQARLRRIENERSLRVAGHETKHHHTDAERKRRAQLGEHDMPVPVVRPASGTPEAGLNMKRKRGSPSPPASAPKGPRLSNNGMRPKQQPQAAQPRPPQSRTSIDPVPPWSHDDDRAASQPNEATNSVPPTLVDSNASRPRVDDHMPGSSTTSLGSRQVPNLSRQANISTQLNGGATTDIKMGDWLNKPLDPQPPFSQHNMARPSNVRVPKRKKDADPFIRPKRK